MPLDISVELSAWQFGPHALHPGQVFFESPLSLGIVNLRPIVPGHVLMIPKRVCARLADLSAEEVADLFASVHRAAPLLENHYNCSALSIAVQDGADAGQTVPHVHVHILPRRRGDFERNDEVHERLDAISADSACRPSRSIGEMSEEAVVLRRLFQS
jgi:diadenosine tetraphosphate (Ap4A) HIT family hydrolase